MCKKEVLVNFKLGSCCLSFAVVFCAFALISTNTLSYADENAPSALPANSVTQVANPPAAAPAPAPGC